VIARESLNDPDQTLLLEKGLSLYEGSVDLAKLKSEQQKERIAELESFVAFAAKSFALRRSLCSEGY
jgi:hypothetical protein